jgi:hypothetical protein
MLQRHGCRGGEWQKTLRNDKGIQAWVAKVAMTKSIEQKPNRRGRRCADKKQWDEGE